MTKLKMPPPISAFIDEEEKDLIESIENGPMGKPLPPKELKKEIAMLQQAVKNTWAARQQMNLRVDPAVKEAIKTKAKAAGIPYQTLINTLLAQYAAGKISLKI